MPEKNIPGHLMNLVFNYIRNLERKPKKTPQRNPT
jgi:hypothetical protein